MKFDTSGWGEFKLDSLFEKVKVKKLPYKVQDLKDKFDDIYNLPALTAGIENQGLSCYVPRQNASILQNVISVSGNGANSGAMFFQPNEFTILQDSYAIACKFKTLNQFEGLYLISVIQRMLKHKFDWRNKAGWDKLKKEKISLPTDKDGKPDWEFMENTIKSTQNKMTKIIKAYELVKNGGGGGTLLTLWLVLLIHNLTAKRTIFCRRLLCK